MDAQDRALFRQGLQGGAAVGLASAPFGALFGALAHDQGMSLTQLTLMSGAVYAGASQMVGLDLFGHQVAPWLVVLSILAVNFRHVLYSAAIAPHFERFSAAQKAFAFFFLIDPQFAQTARRGEAGLPITPIWYFSFALAVYVPWLASSLLGGLLGRFIGDPAALGFDILLPVYFLGLVVGFRAKRNFAPVVAVSALASVVAYHVVGSPWHVSLGALVAVAVAAALPPPDAGAAPVASLSGPEV